MQQSTTNPDLGDISAFVTLAECGSFVAAGHRLHRNPTAVSRRVQSLEARLGVRLAERSTRKVVLTEAGREYLERIRPLLEGIKAAELETAALEGEPRGCIKLALPSAFGRRWISPLLPLFLRKHPLVSIDVSFSNTYVDLIGEGYDLAVRLGSLADSRLIARKVVDRHRLLCAAPAYLEERGMPQTPDELVNHACLRFTGKVNPHVWEFIDAERREHVVPVSGPLASDDAEALVQAGIDGLGIVYATDWLVGRELADGRLVRVLPDWSLPNEGGIYIVTPSTAGLPTKTRAFADWIARQLGRAPWSDPSA
ncbi:DNA-binding transcriptional LysR family regulator [Rhizobium sp. BK650]|uniref:LysR family transcriptional regulator n=1 Tax=Rhizobium sp. BK650 TaxID=2586990 RepID=UPI00161D068C|nr:LysR family transcriptional regulator [Rhizobium sp. BK650]MBB3656890.1 DNA-binding transcriptional LysR family regulator [Rhizobium sp. BK650]